MYHVEFPGLWGVTFLISKVAISIGYFAVYWYGIIIASALMIGIYMATKQSGKFGIKESLLTDLILIVAPISVICARIYYVIFQWDEFAWDLYKIVNLRTGGLAIYGAIIGAVASAYIFARIKKIDGIRILDYLIPYLALGQAIGRWGNFFNQEAFGTNTLLPWGMKSEATVGYLEKLQAEGWVINPQAPVHPTFLYESLWNIALFWVLYRYRDKRFIEGRGEVAALYFILYGLGRVWIEGLRTDSLMIGNFRVSQMLSMGLIFVGSIVFIRLRSKNKTKSNLQNEGA